MPFGTGFNAFSIRDWHLAACKMGLQEAASAFMGVLIASELARLAPLGPPIAGRPALLQISKAVQIRIRAIRLRLGALIAVTNNDSVSASGMHPPFWCRITT
jgi:hypothetical protein